MRIAALQMQSVPADVEANLVRVEDAMRGAAARGARLLVVPELALMGYGAGSALPDLAVAADDPLMRRLGALATRHGVALVAGFAERAGPDVFNSAVFTDGETTSVYRKSQLYGAYERKIFRPAPPSTSLRRLGGLTFGLLVCYDVEFPENVRRLAQAGADVVLVPTALPAGPSGTFIVDHMLAVRAFENQVFVAYVDNVGTDGRFVYAGRSRILAPDGSVLAEAPEKGELMIVADVDPARFARSRAENTYLADLGALAPPPSA